MIRLSSWAYVIARLADAPEAVLEPGAAAAAVAVLLEMPAGASGFRLRAKPVVEVEAVVAAAVVVDVAVEVAEVAAAGPLRLKPNIPAPGAADVVVGAPRVRPLVAEVVGAVAMETKSEDAALVVAAAGAAGCVAPAPVAAGVAGVKVNPVSAVGWAALPTTELMLKPEVPVWDALPPVNEKPPGVAEGAEEVVEEPNTKPVGAEAWVEAAVVLALARVLLPSPKPPVCVVAGVAAAVLLRFSFGALIPRKPVPPVAGVEVPKLKPVVCVAGA